MIQVFSDAQSQAQLGEVFSALLTPSEIHDVALRLEILKQLKAGKTQRSIAESLGVGIATVTRGSRQLQQLEGRLDQFLI